MSERVFERASRLPSVACEHRSARCRAMVALYLDMDREINKKCLET